MAHLAVRRPKVLIQLSSTAIFRKNIQATSAQLYRTSSHQLTESCLLSSNRQNEANPEQSYQSNSKLFPGFCNNNGPGLLGASGYKSSNYRIIPHTSHKINLRVVNSSLNIPLQNLSLLESNVYSSLIDRLGGHRSFHSSSSCWTDPKPPSSQVEITVNALKEKAEAKNKEKSSAAAASVATKTEESVTESLGKEVVPSTAATADDDKVVVKKSLWIRFKEEMIHYYHGFRLLFIDTKICSKYCYRVIRGEKLSRREYRQLIRTTGDLFRLVPFTVFLIIPFMELLLPVALKLFPGMLPSTFETANEAKAKMKKTLKAKLEMAKFLQQTLDTMSLEAKDHHSESAKEFVLFFEKVRRTGETVSNEEILKFSKLFQDSITLDSLSRPQLQAICTLLEMKIFGTNNFLRLHIRMKLRSIIADDRLIAVEGTHSLSPWELQQACRSRGMRAYGVTNEKLRQQLDQWLELSLDQKVPQSLLLLSRTLYLPETIDPNASLAATISQLPDELKTRTKAAIGKREGKIDNLTRLEVIRIEEKKILEDQNEEKEELAKQQLEVAKVKEELGIGEAEVVHVGTDVSSTVDAESSQSVKVTKATVSTEGELQEDKELLIDSAPTLVDKAPEFKEEMKKTEDLQLSTQDLAEVEEALETIGAKNQRLLIEEQDLTELKTEMLDYQEDIEDFKKVVAEVPEGESLKVSKAARRLYRKINNLISQTDPVIKALSKKTEDLQKVVDAGDADKQDKNVLVNLEDLVSHLKQVSDTPDSTKLSVISDVLTTMDTDNDGAIKIEHILKALELLSEDKVGVPRKLFEEVVLSIAKQDQVETKKVVQRAITTSYNEEEGQEKGTKKSFMEEGQKIEGTKKSVREEAQQKDPTKKNSKSDEVTQKL